MIYFETFLKAVVSTIGAFVPVFILMYVHFRIRKNIYKRMRQLFVDSVSFYKKAKEDYQKELDKIYEQFEVTNLVDLMKKINGNVYITEIAKVTGDLESQLSKNELEEIKEESKLRHIDTYDFKTYLSSLLNKRFPDPYFDRG